MAEGRAKYFTKSVKFGGKELVLYSLDGATWSTRRTELAAIKERQEKQRITLADLKSEEEESEKPEENESEERDDEAPVIVGNSDEDSDEEEAAPASHQPAPVKRQATAKVTRLPDLAERKAAKAVAGHKLANKKLPARTAVKSLKSKTQSAKVSKKNTSINKKGLKIKATTAKIKRKAA